MSILNLAPRRMVLMFGRLMRGATVVRSLRVSMASVLLVAGLAVPTVVMSDRDLTASSSEEACVSEALERSLELWTCLGGTLSYFGEEKGVGRVTVSEAVAPTAILETIAPAMASSSAATDAAPMSTSDLDNYWCEGNVSTCTSISSNYSAKTKGNIIWGNTQGVSGSFDMVIISNLNGRSSKAQVKIFRDRGANVKFTNLSIECRHDGNAFGCGSKFADKGDGVVNVTSSWIGPVVQGNKLMQNGTYHDRVTGRVTPTGAPVLPMPDTANAKFKCTDSGCKFPR